jgi:RNA polymerase sigma factor (sigma-70 family)
VIGNIHQSNDGQSHAGGFNGPPGPDWSDEALVRNLQCLKDAADEGSFEILYYRHQASVFQEARSVVSEADAWDVSQEVFLYLWRRTPALGSPFNIKGLLHKKTRGQALDVRSKQQRHELCDPEELGLILPEAGAEDQLDRAALWARIQTLVTQAEYRVLRRRFLEDLSCAETAQKEGIRISTVKSRLHHATEKLRKSKFLATFCPPGPVNKGERNRGNHYQEY